jgi:hypothetical protein
MGLATLRKHFPQQHDPTTEDAWLGKWAWTRFDKYLVGQHKSVVKPGAPNVGRTGPFDEDDDEPDVAPQVVKREVIDDQTFDLQDTEPADETPAHPIAEHVPLFAEDNADPVNVLETPVMTKRSWQYINGKLVVWPPFEEGLISDESKKAGPRVKREFEDETVGDEASAKRRK